MAAKARSRTPADVVCTMSGSPEDMATKTTPAISAAPVHRGSTPARMTASPKANPESTITAPWMPTQGPIRSTRAFQSRVWFTSATTTVPVKKTKLYAYPTAPMRPSCLIRGRCTAYSPMTKSGIAASAA